MKHANRRTGFTLIELLVVIAIISLLMAILLPTLGKSKAVARQLVCRSNLRQIYYGGHAYAMENKGFAPDKITTGNWIYRRAPGLKDDRDPRSLEESFGLAAILDRNDHIPGNSDVWICPAYDNDFAQYENTYAFSIANALSDNKLMDYAARQPKAMWVWDNYSSYPGAPGFRGPFRGYNIASDQRTYPHLEAVASKNKDKLYLGTNALYYDGHADYRWTVQGNN